MDRTLGNKRAPLQDGHECGLGLIIGAYIPFKASISGVIQFSYQGDTNVWMAFCELWGPLTNTLYHGADSDCSDDFSTLVRYAGLPGSKPTLLQVRHIFRDTRYLSFQASSSYGVTVAPRRNLLYRPLKRKNQGFWRDLLASIARVSQSLSALCSMIDICKLNTIEICWLSSKIEEIFGVVETTTKIKELVNVNRVKALSDQDLSCSSKIAHIECHLNNLSCKALKLKVKEQEI
ncbi:hypothetical protein Cgig2_025564 [Carnegiea gigantea]|uniref:Uncharacterized protein n=1 Tax=Carnegiea gigantea TaxID=171969 RepID=A0A9Q1JFY2_9CARY|nr:hypothetical protein Cgig2_025564 [Carnegiea gigantea]